jgi:hypothetical protein
MAEIEIRKIVTGIEEVWHDGGPPLADPVRKGAIGAVIRNPYAGRYVEDIAPMMEALRPLALDITRRLIAALDAQGPEIEAYGKGAIVGAAGELEHGALWHVPGGYAMREILGNAAPRVGILSNGTEEHKGSDLTREAAELCRQTRLNFIGYAEGHDAFENRVDVVVTDGFIGNIVLKSIEGMGKGIKVMLETELTKNPLRTIGAALAYGGIRHIKRRMNPDSHGGAPLLGLNGTVIKAHGSAREIALMNAIRVATETLRQNINQQIIREIADANERIAGAGPADPATAAA